MHRQQRGQSRIESASAGARGISESTLPLGSGAGPSAPRGQTRRRILTTLKKSDGLTADQLAVLLGITSMAVRKHLAALERDGLVEPRIVRRAVGRPAHVYRISSMADDFFPKHYDLVVTDLLTDLMALDGAEKVDLLLSRRSERTRAFLTQYVDRACNFAERVEALADGMDELGYLATCEQVDEGTYLLKQYNCAIHCVATCFPGACDHEAEIYRDLLDAEVERTTHIVAGDHMCCYLIRAKQPQS